MAEEPEDREDASMVFVRAVEAWLDHDVRDVRLDGPFADPEAPSDADVGTSLRHQGEHIVLARGEDRGRFLAVPRSAG